MCPVKIVYIVLPSIIEFSYYNVIVCYSKDSDTVFIQSLESCMILL